MSSDDPAAKLRAAVEQINKQHPLPRCEHGNALKDHANEILEPPCGCRWEVPAAWATAEAGRLYDEAYWSSARSEAVLLMAAALIAAEQRGAEKAAKWIEEPYPEDMFPPLNETGVREIVKLLDANKQGHGLMDRLHAGWARHWAGVIRERNKEQQ